MKLPKLLPWYARKAGISTERAEALWRKAVREATAETGWVGNSEFWGATMNHFITLLEKERNTLCTPHVLPIVRSQNRIWRLSLLALEDWLTATRAASERRRPHGWMAQWANSWNHPSWHRAS